MAAVACVTAIACVTGPATRSSCSRRCCVLLIAWLSRMPALLRLGPGAVPTCAASRIKKLTEGSEHIGAPLMCCVRCGSAGCAQRCVSAALSARPSCGDPGLPRGHVPVQPTRCRPPDVPTLARAQLVRAGMHTARQAGWAACAHLCSRELLVVCVLRSYALMVFVSCCSFASPWACGPWEAHPGWGIHAIYHSHDIVQATQP